MWACERGATAVEYGLLLALLTLALIAAWTQVGARLSAKFTTLSQFFS